LGQLRELFPSSIDHPSFSRWKQDLTRALSSRSFASFHDRLSGGVAPSRSSPMEGNWLSNPDLARRMYGVPRGRPIELVDHYTEDLFAQVEPASRVFFVWNLVPGAFHLIEGV